MGVVKRTNIWEACLQRNFPVINRYCLELLATLKKMFKYRSFITKGLFAKVCIRIKSWMACCRQYSLSLPWSLDPSVTTWLMLPDILH